MRIWKPFKRILPLSVLEEPQKPLRYRLMLALSAALLVWSYEMVTYVALWTIGGYSLKVIGLWVVGRIGIIPFIAVLLLLARSLTYRHGFTWWYIVKHLGVMALYAVVIRIMLRLLNWFGPQPDVPPVVPPITFWEHMSVLRHWSAWAATLNEILAGYFLGLLLMFAGDMLLLYRSLQQRTAELARANLRLEEASLTDPLTGAHNRRYLTNQLPADIAYFRRLFAKEPDLRMVFVQMDLDHFKRINDAHGHDAGDRALVEFVSLLHRVVRQGDYLVRSGGEEFLVVLRAVPADQVTAYATRLYDAVRKFRFTAPDGKQLGLTCSIGFAEYPLFPEKPDAFAWEDVVKLADRAMYHAKQSGRNRWVLLRPGPGTRPAMLHRDFTRDLAWLVKCGRLELLMRGPRTRKAGR